MQALLEARDNSRAPPPAPAHGLYLTRVEYPQGCLDGSAPAEADVAEGDTADEGEEDYDEAEDGTTAAAEPVGKRQKMSE